MEVYVCRIEITDSLMRPLIVPVMNETSMAGKHPALADVRLMEGLNLPDRRRPPHACDDMLNPVCHEESLVKLTDSPLRFGSRES
jgi:hypothetical protein